MTVQTSPGVSEIAATALGTTVLAHFERGRQKAIDKAKARSRDRATVILDLLQVDLAKKKAPRGRPGRIYRRLKALDIKISESQVRRILCTLLSVEDSDIV